MPRSKTSSKPQVVLSRVRWIIAVAILAGVAFSAIAFRSNGTTTVSAQRADDRIAAPDATTVISGNLAPITINDNTTASLYPSDATVSGVNQSITRVRLQLNNFSHTFPDDVDIILEGPQGQRAMVMSDAGAGVDVSGLNLTFDSAAALSAVLPDELPLTTGTFRAANYGNGGGVFTDTFPAPFPAPNVLTDGPADLSVFHQTNPNGTWRLYVVDDAGTDVGTISGGWTLILTVPNIFTVINTNDSGLGSLRQAITDAMAATGNSDQVSFDSSFNTPKTIDLLTPLPDITESMAIVGPGANLLTVRRSFAQGTPDFRIFNITNAATTGVAISGMTISNGRPSDLGGAIQSYSTLTLTNAHFTGNQAAEGGAVYLRSADGIFTGCTFSNNVSIISGGAIRFDGIGGRTLRVVNSTVSGNNTLNLAGAIENYGDGGNSRVEIVNSTITGNTGGGLDAFTFGGAGNTATTVLRNTIIVNNSPNNFTSGSTTGGGPATFQTLGFNLSNNYNGQVTPIATDITTATPRLAPLAMYGGQTPTHALLHSSPAIGAGDRSSQTTDQRGQPRPDAGADIGAVEMQTNASLTVINNANSGAGSLPDAIAFSNANPTLLADILFDNTFFSTQRTITLGGTQLAINGKANIIAPAADLVTVSGGNASRVFSVNSGATATLSGMTITGGNGSGGGGGAINVFSPNTTLNLSRSRISGNSVTNGNGGGLVNSDNAVVNISDSTFANNTSTFNGGAIQNETATLMTIRNTTISGNTSNSSSPLGGGGIHQTGTGTLTITNSTITNNTAAGNGGGIRMANGSINVRNTIIAGNIDTSGGNAPNIFGTFVSNGFNLIGNSAGGSGFTNGVNSDQVGSAAMVLNPGLASLALNGGQMPTHALLFGSPALDTGNSSGSTSDQRGLTRPIDLAGITNTSDASDIGAFEAQTAPVDNPPTAAAAASGINVAGASTYTFTVTYTDDAGINVSTLGTGDVTVSGPGGFTATPTFISVNNGTNGTPRTATYSFTPPGGTWNNADNGSYNVDMVANQVSDTGGNFVAAGTLATFTVNILVCSGGAPQDSVYFSNFETDDGGFVESGFGDWERGAPILGVFEFCGTTPTAEPLGAFSGTSVWATNLDGCYQNSGDASVISRTFDLSNLQAPITFSWQDWHHVFTSFDIAQVRVNGNAIYSVPNANFSTAYQLESMDLSPFAGQSNVVVDFRLFASTVVNRAGWYIDDVRVQGCTAPTQAPTATATVNNVSTGGGSSYTFTVTYSDDTAINVSTIGTGDVTVSGPGGFAATPTFVSVNPAGNGTPRTATYSFVPPGGSWDAGDNGTYTINMVAGQVADTGGTFVPAGVIGTFNVGICNFILAPASPQSVPAASSNLSVTVTTTAGCAWTATTMTSWITINSGTPGNGSGTVNMTFAANTGTARSGSLTIAGQTYTINQAAGSAIAIRAPFDYDGDNKTDISIFRPAPGEWWVLRSTNGGNFALQFGNSSDKLVPADYTGDGKTDVAFWRPSTGFWFVLRSEDFSFFSFPFGATGDVPVPADYDGDGKADAAVFRESSLTWFISKSTGGTDIVGFGATGDKPVVADYDGDRKADIGIFRPTGATGPAASEWWIRRSSNASVFALQFGASTDKAIQGDYTGDGKADVAFWRPSNGNWFVLRSEDLSFFAFPFGANGDVPVPGDYDADGRTDSAVFRPSSFTWFIQRSTAGTLIQSFGIPGDVPTPSAYIP